MKILLIILFFISILAVSCSKENNPILPPVPPGKQINLAEEISLLPWNELSGKIAYVKYDTILLINCDERSIKKLARKPVLSNMKWNNNGTMITGMRLETSSNFIYYLEGIDLEGNKTELKTNLNFSNGNFDWLPDGRIVYWNIHNRKIIIEDEELPVEGLVRTGAIVLFNGLACSYDGQKIMVSTSTWDSTQFTTGMQLVEVDINTLSKQVMTTSNSSWPWFGSIIYAPNDYRGLYIKNFPDGGGRMLYLTPNQLLKEGAYGSAWSPDGDKILVAYDGDIYLVDINNLSIETKILTDASLPMWTD